MSRNDWARRGADKRDRLSSVTPFVDGKVIDQTQLRDTLQSLLRPGDRVALEGDNQKQADFLSRTLAQCDPGMVNGLHMLISSESDHHADRDALASVSSLVRFPEFAYGATKATATQRNSAHVRLVSSGVDLSYSRPGRWSVTRRPQTIVASVFV